MAARSSASISTRSPGSSSRPKSSRWTSGAESRVRAPRRATGRLEGRQTAARNPSRSLQDRSAPAIEADVIYTFWVKHAICTDPSCRKEVPLFKDYFVARRRVHRVLARRDVPGVREDFRLGGGCRHAHRRAALMVQAPAARRARAGRRLHGPIARAGETEKQERDAPVAGLPAAPSTSVNVPWDRERA